MIAGMIFRGRLDSRWEWNSPAFFFVLLLLPSLYLWFAAPPLWRDTDAWNQITSPPNVSTLVHFGPAYCFGMRFPMWLGTIAGAIFGDNPFPRANFFRTPAVSDAGIAAILLTQHLLLAGALTLLVWAAAAKFIYRLIIAAFALLQAPIYIYAQCVGGEALTLILLISLTALLRWVADVNAVKPWIWAAFFGLLLIAILTRHPNAAMAAILPGCFLIEALATVIRDRKWQAALPFFRPFAIAVIAGLATILIAQGVNRLFCWAGGEIPRSTAGYTLQWKLGYMSEMTPEQRRDYWNQVLGPNQAAEFPEAILKINPDQMKEDGWWVPRSLFLQILAEIQRQNPEKKRKVAAAEAEILMNQLVKPFWFRGGAPYWESVQYDFLQGLQWRPVDISNHVIKTTADYFAYPEMLTSDRYTPIFQLKTFRGKDAGEVFAQFHRLAYIDKFPYLLPPNWVFLVGAILVGIGLLIEGGPRQLSAASAVFSTVAVALLIWFLIKLLTQNLPRFAAPLYASLFASFAYGLGWWLEGLRLRRGESAK